MTGITVALTLWLAAVPLLLCLAVAVAVAHRGGWG